MVIYDVPSESETKQQKLTVHRDNEISNFQLRSLWLTFLNYYPALQ